MRWIFAICLLVLSSEGITFTNQQQAMLLVVIGNESVPPLEKESVKSLYTLQRKLLPNGAKVNLAMLPISDPSTVELSQILYGFYPYQLSRHWDTQVFSGRAQLPKEFSTQQDLIKYVHSTSNAVGYLLIAKEDLPSLKEKVNVIATFE